MEVSWGNKQPQPKTFSVEVGFWAILGAMLGHCWAMWGLCWACVGVFGEPHGVQ